MDITIDPADIDVDEETIKVLCANRDYINRETDKARLLENKIDK